MSLPKENFFFIGRVDFDIVVEKHNEGRRVYVIVFYYNPERYFSCNRSDTLFSLKFYIFINPRITFNTLYDYFQTVKSIGRYHITGFVLSSQF